MKSLASEPGLTLFSWVSTNALISTLPWISADQLGHLKIKDLAKIELHFTEWKTLKVFPHLRTLLPAKIWKDPYSRKYCIGKMSVHK